METVGELSLKIDPSEHFICNRIIWGSVEFPGILGAGFVYTFNALTKESVGQLKEKTGEEVAVGEGVLPTIDEE